MYNLGVMYERGIGVEQNDQQGFQWYLKSANQGNVEAQFNLALFYGRGRGTQKNIQQSIFWLKKAASQGHLQAQKFLKTL